MLNICTIDMNYNKYLREFDNRVAKNNDEEVKRPYIGFLLSINELLYFTPLLSPKIKFEKMKNSIDFEKIEDGKYGAINFNNMIPVKLNFINYIMINNELDLKYKNILINQYRWINKNENKLIKKANNLYKLIVDNKADKKLKYRCCDFKLLEEKAKLYKMQKKNKINIRK